MPRWIRFLLTLALVLLPVLPAAAAEPPAATAYQADDEGDEADEPEEDADDEGGEAEEASGPRVAGDTPASDEEAEISIYRELKTVEAQVNGLKEKVFRSKARLLLLEEKVIRGVVSGAKAVIRHKNSLGPAYELESVTYYFDGNAIFQKTDVTGQLGKERLLEIFEANIPPGNHTLSVTGVIKGKGTGLFSYLNDYTFNISSTFTFYAEDGKTTRLDAHLFKKGGPLGDYADGPAYEFVVVGGDAAVSKKGQQAETGVEDAAE